MIPRTVVLLFAVVVTTAARCPIGAVQGLRADRCYVFPKEALIFGEAGGNCAYQGGHLVSVSSAFENSFIRLLLAGSDDDYWLGGYALTPGNWVWEDGKNFTYTNWDRGQPQAQSDQGLAIQPRTGKWLSADPFMAKNYACELPPLA